MADDSVITQEVDRVFNKLGITGQAAAVLMIIFGILVLIFPNLVGILVGLYLIVVGLLQLLGHWESGRSRPSPPPPAPPYTGPPMP